ncbi:MAG: DNA internalization-related competence protein ComEC/Rec2, partial [Dehalococcoidales bacterium]|nr:DNA internalization-related competence protein ComEC/Rec2 [Dehalococcoidales bacterium]
MILVSICCAWVLGIFLGSLFDLHWMPALSGLAPLALLLVTRKRLRLLAAATLCPVALFAAAAYYPSTIPEETPLAAFNNQGQVTIEGVVESQPEFRENTTHIELSARKLIIDSTPQEIQGTVLIFAPRYPEYRYGDILLVTGELKDPPIFEDFDYQAYLAREGIFSTMVYPKIELSGQGMGIKPLAWIYSFREDLSQSIAKALPEPQASLAQGIVLGIRANIPDSLKTDLSITGTAHLLAISGINLSIIAGIMVMLGLRIFGRRYYLYVWLALITVWFYAVITGFQSPVVRSAIMASMFLFAELLGRQRLAAPALAFSAALMVGISPQILWSISFQLSFLAMIGLIYIAPALQDPIREAIDTRLGEDRPISGMVSVITGSISITLGAIIAVWPVIAYNFGIFSIAGPISTLLIAPALSFIIILGSFTAVTGLFSQSAAQITGWIAWIFLSYMLWMVKAFAALPLAAVNTGHISSHFIWAYYFLLALAVLVKTNYKSLKKWLPPLFTSINSGAAGAAGLIDRTPKKLLIIPLLLPAFLTSFAAATMPDRDLHVSFFDVGQGDSILIRCGNQSILIDGGPGPQAVCLGLSEKMPFWDRNIDLMILTHPHQDHLNGLIEVLRRYRVDRVLSPGLDANTPEYREWLYLIESKNIAHTTASAGQYVELGNGGVLEVLGPPEAVSENAEIDIDDAGLVLRLSLDKVSFLFTADTGHEAEANLIRQRADLSCTVLKVAHHGSTTSTSSAFLSVVQPQIAVISVGRDNSYGHPDIQVLQNLKESTVYRTDESGGIEFITD